MRITKICLKQVFDMNLRLKQGFLTYIPCIPIPEYGESNAPFGLDISEWAISELLFVSVSK